MGKASVLYKRREAGEPRKRANTGKSISLLVAVDGKPICLPKITVSA
jgi:hypothetical protein